MLSIVLGFLAQHIQMPESMERSTTGSSRVSQELAETIAKLPREVDGLAGGEWTKTSCWRRS